MSRRTAVKVNHEDVNEALAALTGSSKRSTNPPSHRHRNKRLTPEIAQDIRDVFDMFDVNGDGGLNELEIKAILHSFGLRPSEDDVCNLIKEFGDPDGRVVVRDYFVHFVEELASDDRGLTEELKETWKLMMLDPEAKGKRDMVGWRDIKIIMAKLGHELTDEEVGELVLQHDTEDKGGLTFDEVVSM